MNFSDNCLQRPQSQASVTGSQLQGKTPHNSKRLWVQPYLVSCLSRFLWNTAEPSDCRESWLAPEDDGWVLCILLPTTGRVNPYHRPSGCGLPGFFSKRPPGCGWGQVGLMASEGLCASDVPLVVSESRKEKWGCTLAPSAPERRCARTSPTLTPGSLRSRGSGAAAALSNYGWPLAWHVTLNTTNLPVSVSYFKKLTAPTS